MKNQAERQGDLVRVSELLGEPAAGGEAPQRRLARVWPDALGDDVARNAQPRHLRAGRLVVATSSAVWAQTLQLMAEDLVGKLNRALGEQLIHSAVFRPAGWDPGGGAFSPRALGPAGDPLHPSHPGGEHSDEAGAGRLGGPAGRPARSLTDLEEAAVRQVRALACDEDLAARISGAMRASLTSRKLGRGT